MMLFIYFAFQFLAFLDASGLQKKEVWLKLMNSLYLLYTHRYAGACHKWIDVKYIK